MITYAGQPLLLEDEEGVLREWFDRYWDLEDLRLFAATPESAMAHGQMSDKAGLPVVNWPTMPKLRLNTLWWPSGATRWAVGLFLVNGARLTSIIAGLTADGTATLVMDDGVTVHGASTSFEATLSMLSPIRVSYAETEAASLWLLPLVDQRYWWQFKGVDDITISPDPSTTWGDLLDDIGTALGVTLNYPAIISGDYGDPDIARIERDYETIGVYLEACARLIGLRVVVDLDETVSLLTAAESETRLQANLPSQDVTPSATETSLVGGYGRKYLPRPDSVRVVIWDSGTLSQRTKTAISIDPALETVTGFVRTLHWPPVFRFTSPSQSLEHAQDRIATDFFGWLHERYDATMPGLIPWQPTGFDDGVMWMVGHRLPSGQYSCCTRAKDLPWDVGLCTRYHQSDSAIRSGKLDGNLDCTSGFNGGISTTLSIWGDSGDTGEDIAVYAPWARPMGVILAGMKVEAAYDNDMGQYVAVAGGKARKIRCTVKTAFTSADSSFIGLYVLGFDGEDPVAVGGEITIENDGNTFSGVAGLYVWAEYAPELDSYRAYQLACPPPSV